MRLESRYAGRIPIGSVQEQEERESFCKSGTSLLFPGRGVSKSYMMFWNIEITIF